MESIRSKAETTQTSYGEPFDLIKFSQTVKYVWFIKTLEITKNNSLMNNDRSSIPFSCLHSLLK